MSQNMPKMLIDVRQRIALLEQRRVRLWNIANRSRVAARRGRPLRDSEAWELAHAAIANAQAQCLTVEIYALRAMAGVGAQDVER